VRHDATSAALTRAALPLSKPMSADAYFQSS
jgi:hypothetical protein